MLDYLRYRTFLKERSAKVLDVVTKRLDSADADFEGSIEGVDRATIISRTALTETYM